MRALSDGGFTVLGTMCFLIALEQHLKYFSKGAFLQKFGLCTKSALIQNNLIFHLNFFTLYCLIFA